MSHIQELGGPETALSQPEPIVLVRGMDDLAALHAFVDALCEAVQLLEEERLTFRLAAEEAFTNIIVHGYDADAARARVEVRAYASDEEIGLELIDQGTPFDPASAPPADVKSGWEERPIGGVGWHLIRELTDRIRYQPNTPMGNRLMLVKRRTAPNETNQEST